MEFQRISIECMRYMDDIYIVIVRGNFEEVDLSNKEAYIKVED